MEVSVWDKTYKCRTRVILSLGEKREHLRNYKCGKVNFGSQSSVNIILTTWCTFLKNNPNLHTLFAPMTYFHSFGYTWCVLNGIFAIEIDICFSFTNAIFHHFYLHSHHHHINIQVVTIYTSLLSGLQLSKFSKIEFRLESLGG